MFIYRTCRVDWIVRPTYIAPCRGLQVDATWSVANYARNTLANPWVLSHAWHNTQDLWFKPGSSFLRMQMRMRYEFQRHKFTTNYSQQLSYVQLLQKSSLQKQKNFSWRWAKYTVWNVKTIRLFSEPTLPQKRNVTRLYSEVIIIYSLFLSFTPCKASNIT